MTSNEVLELKLLSNVLYERSTAFVKLDTFRGEPFDMAVSVPDGWPEFAKLAYQRVVFADIEKHIEDEKAKVLASVIEAAEKLRTALAKTSLTSGDKSA